MKVCEKLLKPVTILLEKAQVNGEIHVDDIQAAATFCVYGQLGILLENHIPAKEKSKRIRAFLIYALRL